MNPVANYSFLLIIPTVILLHLFAAPYTKVEESFNIQAVHDILKHGIPLKDSANQLALKFDHVTFSGAVPRTFIGALSLAELARPLSGFVFEGPSTQVLARGILGTFNALALLSFYDAIRKAFGNVAGYWYILLQASQFHVIYYASRTLPNMFAFVFTTFALRSLVLSSFGPHPRRAKRQRLSIYLITMAGVIFRSELAILVGTISLSMLLTNQASFTRTIIPAGLLAAAIALTATVCIDSFFWQKYYLWPEWAAFYFNTVEGKSADWGTSPWHYYFSSAIPRLMLNPTTLLLCIPTALLNHQTRRFSVNLLVPLLAFVALFSILPHKEWRFIVYIIPGLTAVASAGASHIWTRRSRSFLTRAASLLLVASVAASFLASTLMLLLSALNYPGAFALTRLHALADGSKPAITVHLGNLACQTGVTRFLQLPAEPSALYRSVWHYDKSEGGAGAEGIMGPLFYDRFDYLLVEVGSPAEDVTLLGTWEVVETVVALGGVGVVKLDDAEDTVLVGPGNALDLVAVVWKQGERWLRRHVTGGRWVAVKMEPKIRILRNVMRTGIAS